MDLFSALFCRQCQRQPVPAAGDLGYWFEYRAARLRAQARAGTASPGQVLAWFEQCGTFPEARWKDMLAARPQSAAGVLAAAMPLLQKHDLRIAARWLEEVTGWLATQIEEEPRDFGSFKSQAELAVAAAHLAVGEPAVAAWEKAAAAWREGRKVWPHHADFGLGEAACRNEMARLCTASGDLDCALAAWRDGCGMSSPTPPTLTAIRSRSFPSRSHSAAASPLLRRARATCASSHRLPVPRPLTLPPART